MGEAGHHRPLTVEITADTLILRWLHDAPWNDDPWGRPATITPARWEPAHALVAAIIRAREARMARLNWSFSGR